MKKFFILSLFFTIGFTSCKNSDKGMDNVEIAKQYFNALDNSNYHKISVLFTDSLITKEGEYEVTYSQSEYIEFLKWDSVFNPSYKILEIEQQKGTVKAKISKMDKRISFLHEEPFVTNQVLKFQKDKIISIENEYVNFKSEIWERNRTELLKWIDENHPELNGFINDQTETGGIKFLKAINLYINRE